MAGVIQVGDLIKFAELAWTVWNYGWANEHNAGENYRAFGADVRTLHASLTELEKAVTTAQSSLRDHGASERDRIGGDQKSLLEIIGDYEATLKECQQLLEDNRRYAHTTGPMRNIDWNLNIMPQVEHLRGRIQMHNSRIQHVLRPFQIDLITKIHQDLVRRMLAMHRDVLVIRRNLDTFLKHYYPDIASEIEQKYAQELFSVQIPDSLLDRLEVMLNRRQTRRVNQPLMLPEMVDCFLTHLGTSTVQFRPGPSDFQKCPPVASYLSILKCQLLMNRMKASDELQNPLSISHWPGYIDALEAELSHECSRFQTEMMVPDLSMCEDEMLTFWPEDEPKMKTTPRKTGPEHDCLFEASLAAEASATTWKRLRLLRQTDSGYHFRIVEVWGFHNMPPTEEPKVLDFDIRFAVLIPVYADPMGESTTPPRLEIIIEENRIQHHYVFDRLQDVLSFQHSLTGFKVVDGYMESRATAMFIRQAEQNKSLLEDVTVQLWIPSSIKGWPDTGNWGIASVEPPRVQMTPKAASRRTSIASQASTSRNIGYAGYGSPEKPLGEWDGSHSPAGTRFLPSRGSKFFHPSQEMMSQILTSPTHHSSEGPFNNWAAPFTPTISQSPSPQQYAPAFARVPTQPNIGAPNAFLQQTQNPRRYSTYSSYTTANSCVSHSSSSSENTIAVKLDGNSTGTGYGTIRARPRNPLLVLFTRDPTTARRSIVAITLDDETKPNLSRCKCLQSLTCPITALEREKRGLGGLSSSSMLLAQRLENRQRWDLLPLAASRSTDTASWDGLCRVSILFPTAEARNGFGGGYCQCRTVTEGDVDACLEACHQGLLGVVKVYHRRQLVLWREQTETQTHVVDHPPSGQPD